jgi:hypothetical protein
MHRFLWLVPLLALSCDRYQEPLPVAPSPTPPAFSHFQIVGHWEATSNQGRRVAFDVTPEGRIMNGRINLHHDCNTGRWRSTLDGFQVEVVDDSFITTFNWANEDGGVIRTGTMTVSGRFEGDRAVKGGFIDSVNDVRKNDLPTGDVCPSIEGTFEGTRE